MKLLKSIASGTAATIATLALSSSFCAGKEVEAATVFEHEIDFSPLQSVSQEAGETIKQNFFVAERVVRKGRRAIAILLFSEPGTTTFVPLSDEDIHCVINLQGVEDSGPWSWKYPSEDDWMINSACIDAIPPALLSYHLEFRTANGVAGASESENDQFANAASTASSVGSSQQRGPIAYVAAHSECSVIDVESDCIHAPHCSWSPELGCLDPTTDEIFMEAAKVKTFRQKNDQSAAAVQVATTAVSHSQQVVDIEYEDVGRLVITSQVVANTLAEEKVGHIDFPAAAHFWKKTDKLEPPETCKKGQVKKYGRCLTKKAKNNAGGRSLNIFKSNKELTTIDVFGSKAVVYAVGSLSTDWARFSMCTSFRGYRFCAIDLSISMNRKYSGSVEESFPAFTYPILPGVIGLSINFGIRGRADIHVHLARAENGGFHPQADTTLDISVFGNSVADIWVAKAKAQVSGGVDVTYGMRLAADSYGSGLRGGSGAEKLQCALTSNGYVRLELCHALRKYGWTGSYWGGWNCLYDARKNLRTIERPWKNC